MSGFLDENNVANVHMSYPLATALRDFHAHGGLVFHGLVEENVKWFTAWLYEYRPKIFDFSRAQLPSGTFNAGADICVALWNP